MAKKPPDHRFTFLGIDHGTTAIRFATSEGGCWELSRREAVDLEPQEIIRRVQNKLGLDQVDLVALTYSMGDGLTRIVRLQDASNRGLLQQDGAGLHVGGGTRVFEAIERSGWPAILLPGIHRGSDVDPRMKVFSHGMSPEKVGLAYNVFRRGVPSFIVCDASANTVTFGVLKGRIIGAIDAPIFAPGLMQGPLDVQAIRRVDSGEMSANSAFTCGGILPKMGKDSLIDCSVEERDLALQTLALFAAMEVAALLVLLRDLGEPEPAIFLAGSMSGSIKEQVAKLLGREIASLDRCAAATGCAQIAADVFAGAEAILGLEVEKKARRWKR